MNPTALPSSALAHSEAGVLARAIGLMRAVSAGEVQRALTGKHICVVCGEDDEVDVRMFATAATELGAKVSLLRPWLTATSSDTEVVTAARMLERLYDGIAFMHASCDLIARVDRATKIPVFDVIATLPALVAELASGPGDQALPRETRRFVMQAMLLDALC